MAEKTMIISETYGTFTFDAVFNTSHNQLATITEHPLETGASIADHAYIEPAEVPITIGMSDAATDIGTIAGKSSDRSVIAYNRLLALMHLFEPVTLITRLATYENMLITSVSADDDYTTQNALKATVIFKHIQIVSVSTVAIQQKTSSSKSSSSKSSGSSSSSSKSSSSKSSSTTASSGNTSLLKQLANKLGG